MPGGKGAGPVVVRNAVQRFGWWPFYAGDAVAAGRRAERQPPRSRGRVPGDMMMDWASPPAGMRPLSLNRPSAWPCGTGRSG